MEIIKTDNMPIVNGHYSSCIEHNGVLYLAGQLPLLSDTKEVPTSIEEQTRLVLQKIEHIVTEAGSNKNNIIQIRLYISNIELWGNVNGVYSEFFGTHKPVRAVIPTRELHYGCLIETEAIAAV